MEPCQCARALLTSVTNQTTHGAVSDAAMSFDVDDHQRIPIAGRIALVASSRRLTSKSLEDPSHRSTAKHAASRSTQACQSCHQIRLRSITMGRIDTTSKRSRSRSKTRWPFSRSSSKLPHGANLAEHVQKSRLTEEPVPRRVSLSCRAVEYQATEEHCHSCLPTLQEQEAGRKSRSNDTKGAPLTDCSATDTNRHVRNAQSSSWCVNTIRTCSKTKPDKQPSNERPRPPNNVSPT